MNFSVFTTNDEGRKKYEHQRACRVLMRFCGRLNLFTGEL
jgi:hypothetical protein